MSVPTTLVPAAPLTQPTAAPADEAPIPASGAVDVLLIDDEPTIRHVLSAALTHAGYSSRCADNGRTALPLLAEHRFKLIVTDIHMPEMDGLEIIMHCKAANPATRILAISGGSRFNGTSDALRPARLLGSHQTLDKPFTTGEFFAAVQGLIGPHA